MFSLYEELNGSECCCSKTNKQSPTLKVQLAESSDEEDDRVQP